LPPSFAETSRKLAAAEDRQVAQVVALIDGLEQRGAADAVLAPLRARLKRLRPPRPPRLGRLLFSPLDPVIVAPNTWKPGDATVPRPALGVFKDIIVAGLGAQAPALEQAFARFAGDPIEATAAIGPNIWPRAAACLAEAARAAPCPQWAALGLPAGQFAPLAAGAARVLRHAPRILAWTARDAAGESLQAKEIEVLFGADQADGPLGDALLAAVLIAHLPRYAPEILRSLPSAGHETGFAPSPAASLALDAATAHLRSVAERGIEGAPLAELSRTAEQAALLLEAVLRNAGPRRREGLEQIARALETRCRARFGDALAADVIASACALSEAEAERAVPQVEAAARDLRRLQGAARRFGGGADYDSMLRRAAEAIRDLPPEAALTPADRIRLAEILAGPDVALRLFALA